MTLKYLINYMISDYLLDQKAELDRLDKLYEKATSEDRRAEIKEQRAYIYNQGLQALRRHKSELPDCVRQYYLFDGPKPTVEQMSRGLKRIHQEHQKPSSSFLALVWIIIILFILFFLL